MQYRDGPIARALRHSASRASENPAFTDTLDKVKKRSVNEARKHRPHLFPVRAFCTFNLQLATCNLLLATCYLHIVNPPLIHS
jgi:hypothetical protein